VSCKTVGETDVSLKVWLFPHGHADRANISGLVQNTQSKHKSPGTVCHTRNHQRNSAETSSETGFTIQKQSIHSAPDDGSVLKKCVSGIKKPQASKNVLWNYSLQKTTGHDSVSHKPQADVFEADEFCLSD
jgi:hypothetical protein